MDERLIECNSRLAIEENFRRVLAIIDRLAPSISPECNQSDFKATTALYTGDVPDYTSETETRVEVTEMPVEASVIEANVVVADALDESADGEANETAPKKRRKK